VVPQITLNQSLVSHALAATNIADRALLSTLFDVFKRIRVLPEEPFFQ